MTGGITNALHTAASGLSATQRALDVVSGNISNANNDTYSRKVTNFESRSLNGLGAGVKISSIRRAVDEHLLRAARQETSELRKYTSQENYWTRLQQMFGTPEDNSSVSHQINRMQKAMETLAATPERTLEHTNAVYAGRDFAFTMNDMSTRMQELRRQADKEVENAVLEINRLTKKVDELNDDIVAFTSISRDTTDMKDERDAAITELSELIDVDYFSRSDGDIAVFTKKGHTLVDKSARELTHQATTGVSARSAYASGGFTGIYAGDEVPGNDLTEDIKGGKLKGLLEMRDETIPKLQSQLDELASEMREKFNQIHNRGAPYPGLQTAEGERTFINPAVQTIQLSAPQDVTIAVTDADGDQQARSTLSTIMTDGGHTARGPWNIGVVAAEMQSWLRSNGAAAAQVNVNGDGKFSINMNTTTRNFVLRDEAATAAGSDPEDAEISFDKDGDGVTDETLMGFSNFFGLNNFFSRNRPEDSYQSEIQSDRYTAGAGTLLFSNQAGPMAAANPGVAPAPPAGQLLISAGMTLEEVADLITTRVTGVTADVVPDGAGERLRISSDNGSEFTVTDHAGSILSDIGMGLNTSGDAQNIGVRQDIVDAPNRISTSMLQWNADKGAGEYLMTRGNGDTVQELADALTDDNQFDAAGGLEPTNISFSEYATQIIASNSLQAESNTRAVEVQESLTSGLTTKHKNESGVNLDEEMAQLIIYEQSYAAVARVISTLQRMFEALERAF